MITKHFLLRFIKSLQILLRHASKVKKWHYKLQHEKPKVGLLKQVFLFWVLWWKSFSINYLVFCKFYVIVWIWLCTLSSGVIPRCQRSHYFDYLVGVILRQQSISHYLMFFLCCFSFFTKIRNYFLLIKSTLFDVLLFYNLT